MPLSLFVVKSNRPWRFGAPVRCGKWRSVGCWLQNVLIIVVVGAICFYLIDRFVPRRTTGKSAEDPGGIGLPCRNLAAAVAGARR